MPTPAGNEPYHHGVDLKSVTLNISSTFLIVLPILSYLYTDRWQQFCAGVVCCFAIAYLIPPVGWRRPHPYSDDPHNKPKI